MGCCGNKILTSVTHTADHDSWQGGWCKIFETTTTVGVKMKGIGLENLEKKADDEIFESVHPL